MPSCGDANLGYLSLNSQQREEIADIIAKQRGGS
jgi:hypothetical protein